MTITIRKEPYTAADFYISITRTGRRTVRWSHNDRAIETFCMDAERRAKGFIKFLVKYLNGMRAERQENRGG